MGRLSIGQAEEKRETHSSVHMGSVRSTELPTRAVQTRRVPPAVKVTGMQLLTLTRRAGPQPPSEGGERDIDVKARRGPANRRSVQSVGAICVLVLRIINLHGDSGNKWK
ncbi:hypothetical protein CgunFtcFv8_020334 [Champsocephalus gunnari]|uniref:Uncharacterized protein n=1 Tax=Champsocephalus gunnari TaxID=52237 RepID=A0AAN8I0T8_CHAGU|nr:hypothetical protein CgunFtcFv8_020334 [Champsocephalus gunnari]